LPRDHGVAVIETLKAPMKLIFDPLWLANVLSRDHGVAVIETLKAPWYRRRHCAKMVVMTTLGAIACGHPVTARAAEQILRDGGNAFDAIIAAQFAACVAEPVLTSLAGGGYLLAHPTASSPVVYDFFVQTPKRQPTGAIDFHPIHADFGTVTQEFHVGLGAVATPGVVRGMFEIHRDLGSLTMQRLTAPAIDAARRGIHINALQGYIFDVVRPIYHVTEEAHAVYADTREGVLLRQVELADTLEVLASVGDRYFYEGELAEQIVELCRRGGGLLDADDLASYRVERRTPLALEYRNARVMTNPPPSSGGILMGFALELLKHKHPGNNDFGSAAHLAALIEVMALTNDARTDVLAQAGLDEELLETYRAKVEGRPRFTRGTTHISVVDAAGNLAAMTLSNGEGCGHLIPGTGVMLNNMLGEEDLNPTGFNNWPVNQRLTSMMAPTLIELGKTRRWALGSGGSNRIRTAILQVISNLMDFEADTTEAVTRPRTHFERDHLSLEGGFPHDSIASLGHSAAETSTWPGLNLFFGGVHVVEQYGTTLSAVGDPRRGGVGVVVR
jgi:gamma-glutamyltranspeptidase/glutathione hydrolase